MKKVIQLLLIAILCSISLEAFAANWKWVTSTDTMGFYVDIENRSRNPLIGWEKVVFEDPTVRKQFAQSMRDPTEKLDWSDFYYVCYKTQYRINQNRVYSKFLQIVFYDTNNRVITSLDAPQNEPWELVPPNSLNEKIYIALRDY